MKKWARTAAFLAIFISTAGVARSCNLFSGLADDGGDITRYEDFKQSVALKDWPSACQIVSDFRTAGKEPSSGGPMIKSLASGLVLEVYAESSFLNAILSGDNESAVCAVTNLNSSDACADATCYSITNSCQDLIGQSDLSGLLTSMPSLRCVDAYIACGKLKNYTGVAGSAAALAALIECKTALGGVLTTEGGSGPCTDLFFTPGVSPCKSLGLGLACSGAAGTDICQEADCGAGYSDLTVGNYTNDETWSLMGAALSSCP